MTHIFPAPPGYGWATSILDAATPLLPATWTEFGLRPPEKNVLAPEQVYLPQWSCTYLGVMERNAVVLSVDAHQADTAADVVERLAAEVLALQQRRADVRQQQEAYEMANPDRPARPGRRHRSGRSR